MSTDSFHAFKVSFATPISSVEYMPKLKMVCGGNFVSPWSLQVIRDAYAWTFDA